MLLTADTDRPAALMVQDRGMTAILWAAGDPAAALDDIYASLYGEASTDDPQN